MSLNSAPLLAITGFLTISLGLIVLILAYLQAKNKNYARHRDLMLSAVVIQAAFLVQYITRAFILHQETPFEGPSTVRNYIYLPILITHISLALISIGLIAKQVLKSLKNEKKTNQQVPYFEANYRLIHRSFGKKVFLIWLISFFGGITIFLLLYILY